MLLCFPRYSRLAVADVLKIRLAVGPLAGDVVHVHVDPLLRDRSQVASVTQGTTIVRISRRNSHESKIKNRNTS